jgi:hypothetical protein
MRDSSFQYTPHALLFVPVLFYTILAIDNTGNGYMKQTGANANLVNQAKEGKKHKGSPYENRGLTYQNHSGEAAQ